MGDTAKDLTAAQAANIPFLYASWGFGDLDEFQPRASAFPELPEAVADLMDG